jgi:O-antigen ligase
LFSSRIKQAHNDFLSMLVETGAVGLMVYLYFWVGVLRRGWRLLIRAPGRDRALYAFMFGLPLSIFLLSLTGEFFIPRTPQWMPSAIVWWLVIASIFRLSSLSAEN